ncbi:phasin family protein [Microvirga alba]|uniref:Phasin family protein n=1 Tax=Microvirga alba TaxID=2791025 RepID=A0A931BNC7_9HYPH|nr:phasin family protein [Microvirga alba]MBF9232659.1 phasin family protein [Microvirga alba]
MVGIKASNTNKPSQESLDSLTSFAGFWKSSALDLPLMLMSESFRFMGHRFQAQAEHLACLAQCKTAAEAFESQASFAQATVSDYMTETGTIMQEARSVMTSQKAA